MKPLRRGRRPAPGKQNQRRNRCNSIARLGPRQLTQLPGAIIVSMAIISSLETSDFVT